MGFYELPTLSSPPAKKNPIIISNILIAPRNKSLSLEQRPEASTSYLSSDVVQLHRCQNFISTGNFDLPFELRDINTNHNSNISLESFMKAESPSVMKSIRNPSEWSDVDTSRLTPDLNFNCVFTESAAKDTRSLADTMQDAAETTRTCSFFDVELVDGDTRLVSEDPKSPSILITDIEVSQDLPPPIQEEAFKIGSWVIIPYRMKKTTKYFIGQIINTNEDGTLIVKFLRRVKGTTDVFTWPDNDDEDCVSKNCIPKILHEPIINRRGQLIFNDIQGFVLE